MSIETETDIRIAQLLASRLCHDLVGSAGAVNAGLELLQESGGMDADALALAAKSAGQLGRKLTCYRVAFGAGLAGGGSPLAEVRALAEGFVTGGAVRIEWAALPSGLAEGSVSGSAAKLALNLVLVGAESLPRGGVLSAAFRAGDGGWFFGVRALGDRAVLRAETSAGVAAHDPGALDARSVHGFFIRRLAGLLGGSLVARAEEGVVFLEAGPLHLSD